MRKRKKSYTKADLGYLSRFMGALFPDQKRLGEIQAVYDNLTLLGQLLGAGTDITCMRQDFQQLATVLLEQLAREHHKKATLNLDACARMAIDVLTRNLYERTADIGFLATDSQICHFAESVEADPAARDDASLRQALHRHFAEYIAKYSVYHNIVLLAPDGEVLLQLDESNPVRHSNDPLIGEALTTTAPYVEVFRKTDLLPAEDSPLIYAYRVMSVDGSRPVGVLCLCFRFADECRRIFESLVAEDDWNVITLLDGERRVIASSDPYQFPIGARLETSPADGCEIVRFAGREYLATTRPAHPYQGYAGPGWVGQALAPLNHAFDACEAPELASISGDLLQDVLERATLFTRELRDIPQRAATIQQALNRAVWNGNIRLARDDERSEAGFAKVLLREIGITGARTRDVFGESTDSLYKTVVAATLFDCTTQAALAIDIMDRNLYERANDCRWWALTREFRVGLAALGQSGEAGRQRLSDILSYIHSLYTVYDNLMLFDTSGRVVAVSNPAYNDRIGKPLDGEWARRTLALKDSQSYFVSEFAASEHYAGRPTYVFAAAVRDIDERMPVGGIAIVFDASTQFRAMLNDVLPPRMDGRDGDSFALFAGSDGRVIASSHPQFAIGSKLDCARELLALEHGESHSTLLVHDGRYYAVGASKSAGYREYGADDVVALVFTALSDSVRPAGSARRPEHASRHVRLPARGVDSVEIASFHIGNHWYGLRPSTIVAAVDAHRLTPMPGNLEFVAGCLMYDDRAITVFDLGSLLNPPRAGVERRQQRNAGSERQILVLESIQLQIRFGILVDSLGEITEIAARHIEAVPEMMTDGRSLVESLVKPQADDAERRILIVLSPERIVQRVGHYRRPDTPLLELAA